jgi:hypothetical protein
LADAFERDQVEGLVDDATIGQLAGILYEFDSQGRVKIESKEQARARGVPSPDRAEALMLALSQPAWSFEYHSIRELPPQPSKFGEPPFEEDDYRPRGSRRFDGWVGPFDARALKRWF